MSKGLNSYTETIFKIVSTVSKLGGVSIKIVNIAKSLGWIGN
jgi:hypothetical protein